MCATALERAKAWAIANPERARANKRKSYLKHRPTLKPVETTIERFQRLSTPVTESGCWIWLGAVNKDGYGKIKVKGKHLTSHRLSWELHNGEIPNGAHVLHRCDVTGCVNPAHLFLGSNQDNVDDRETKGRSYVLPIHRETKLTEDQVLEIRRLKGIETNNSLGKRFGVHHSHISRLQNYKFWKHVTH